MGYRLSKIYTRTGDKGTTGLGDGSRVEKDHPRVEAFGEVDELNSVIGMVLAHDVPGEVRGALVEVQHDLFDLGGELCIPGHTVIGEAHVQGLEHALEAFNRALPSLEEFILPGGHPAAAACHLARAVCRRAERRVVTLARREPLNDQALIYLNRLSDLLFVAARVIARAGGVGEVLWRRERRQPP
ncbi:MAG: cob(I)yrinic acid a,c-diamide adenosyltransferase [Gammaproteobacteria bacterium]|nr:cob(I)yrinic acid a,c-diamide adenosyltransferase [Gammaproteobacteria bacterium]